MVDERLNRFFDGLRRFNFGTVLRNQRLSECTRWRIGGIAECIAIPNSAENFLALIKLVIIERVPYIVVGSTTNLLFSDEGVGVLIIVVGNQLDKVTFTGDSVVAEAGVWVPYFARTVSKNGMCGAEHMVGIPGTLGGLIFMNGGSQRKSIGERIRRVTALSPDGILRTFSNAECEFSYRSSLFQRNNHIIIEAEFLFPDRSSWIEIRRDLLAILSSRRKKFPQKLPNCGSVFVSNPGMYNEVGPPGSAVEQCGLKGVKRNNAQISPLHANFIVNNGGARAEDVLYLIHLARDSVRKRTGFSMVSEARYVSYNGTIVPAHEKAEQSYG